jgi:hypothetical protein
MLADHVETQLLEHLEVIYHCFTGRSSIQSIWPVSLIQGAKHEDEFSIQQGPLNTINLAAGNCAEAGVALHFVFVQLDGHIVQVR